MERMKDSNEYENNVTKKHARKEGREIYVEKTKLKLNKNKCN